MEHFRNICRRVNERGSELSESQLQDYYHGRVNGSLEGHESSVNSLMFFVNPATDDVGKPFKWAGRMEAQAKLTPLAKDLLRKEITAAVGRFSGLTALEFEEACNQALVRGFTCGETIEPARARVTANDEKETIQAMKDVCDGTVVVCAPNFPLIDQFASKLMMWNSKVGGNKVEIKMSAFVDLMLEMGWAEIKDKKLVMIDPEFKATLTFMRNSSNTQISMLGLHKDHTKPSVGLKSKEVKEVFKAHFDIKFLDMRQVGLELPSKEKEEMERVATSRAFYTRLMQNNVQQ